MLFPHIDQHIVGNGAGKGKFFVQISFISDGDVFVVWCGTAPGGECRKERSSTGLQAGEMN